MSKIAIIGGGISGLSSAYYLSKAASSKISKILLLEANSRLGGWIQTTRFDDGTIFEHGPRSMRGAGKVGINTVQLVEELGLEKDVLPIPRSHPAAQNRYIYVNNQICPLPSGPSGIVRRREPFSKSLMRIGWKEPFKKSIRLHDESIYDFFSRRFSKELAEYVADPVCRGIFAGDCRKLSVKSCFPDVFRMEQEHGSIIRGALKLTRDKTVYPGLVGRMKTERWAMWSLRGGLSQLPAAMEAELSGDSRVVIAKNSPCNKVEFVGDKAKITYKGGEETVDHVIDSTLSKSCANLLEPQHPILSQELRKIPVVSVAVVNLEYENARLPVQGFGHLVPSSQNCKVLGVLYESCIFTEHNRNDGNAIRLTCMMGGAWFDEYFGNLDNCDVNNLQDIAIATVQDHLGIKHDPSRVAVRIQKDCISQYHVGHGDILDNIDNYLHSNRLPLSLVGASYRGVSVNDCIYNAKVNSQKVLDKLTT